ncbi:hypothetical protein [Paracoccus ravus]|uniref:hypothetical protein n=1 Tax=Paracoccus ravus TaxID=2447760 RepID=UPI00106EE24F|nr:hypothetical protein [Paracoccus ravus]
MSLAARLSLVTGAGVTLGAALAAPAEASEDHARRDYFLHCAGCHGLDGMGTRAGGMPAFPGSVGLIAAEDLGRAYMANVPGVMANSLDDHRIAGVMNYILRQWADETARPFDANEIGSHRAARVGDIVAMRRELAARLEGRGKAIAEYPWP